MGGFTGELVVQRDMPPQYAVENIGGNSAGGEAGDFRLGGGSRSRHKIIFAMNCGCVASRAEKTLWAGGFISIPAAAPSGKNLEIQPEIVFPESGCNH